MLTKSLTLLVLTIIVNSLNAVAQDNPLVQFPKNVDIHAYRHCNSFTDTTTLLNKVQKLDFRDEQDHREGNYSRVLLADLNSDGTCEVLHYFSSSLRGWPYDFLTIYQLNQNAELRIIGDFPSFLLSFAESDGQYLQINMGYIGGHKTNPIYYNSVLRYNGSEYIDYYSPGKTKEYFRESGLEAFRAKRYETAYTNFWNAYITPHHGDTDRLHDANNVAITLIKLRQCEKAKRLLLLIINKPKTFSPQEMAAAYFNLGLCEESDGDYKKAFAYFSKSCDYKETSACERKKADIIKMLN